jgi:hypothetical protein
MRNSFRRTVAITLMVTTTHLACIGAAQSALVGTDAARTDTTQIDAHGVQTARAKLATFLDRPDVARQMTRLGVPADEAKARAAALTDDEVLAAAGRLDQMPAGGDGFGALIGAAVLIFIVLLVTDILGFTKVFSFTKPIKR